MPDKSINPTQEQETAIMRYKKHSAVGFTDPCSLIANVERRFKARNAHVHGINSQGSLETKVM